MDINLNDLSQEEKTIYAQIKEYSKSQKIIKKIIQENIQLELDLYMINDKWLNQWKKYSCYEEIQFNLPLKNLQKWKEIRQNNNAEQYIVGNMDNKNLTKFDNTYVGANLNFHFITKECFDIFSKNQNNQNEKIVYKFISGQYKLISKRKNNIFVIYKNRLSLNLFIFILYNPNDNYIFEEIQYSNMEDYLKKNGNEQIMENFEIKNNSIYIINKSLRNVRNKEKSFLEIISSLINFDYNFASYLESEKIEKRVMYLINEDWLQKFKLKLNYIFWAKNINNGINFIVRQMFNEFIKNNYNDNIEFMNLNKNILTYLKDNRNSNIIKYYDNYALINEEVWENLKRFFNWNNEICVNIYIMKNHIIIKYDENSFEIIEIINNKISYKLLFCLDKNYKVDIIVNEIQQLGINNYYHKYNINILNLNQSSQKLLDSSNNNQYIGNIINIKIAKNNSNDFTLLNNNDNNNIDKDVDIFIDNIINNNYTIQNISNHLNIENIKKNYHLISKFIKPVIQFLNNCDVITTYLLRNSNFNILANYSPYYKITYPFAQIIKLGIQNNNSLFFINVLIDKLHKKHNNIPIQDFQTLYKLILEDIHEENKGIAKKNNNQNQLLTDERKKIFTDFFENIYIPENTSIIANFFYGIMELTTNCSKCNKLNYEYDIFKYIEFNIEDIIKDIMNNTPILFNSIDKTNFNRILNNAYRKTISLEHCFNYYLNFNLQKKNFLCPKCNFKADNSSYSHKLIILPNILCIVLKRDEKQELKVEFGLYLDISNYLEKFVEKKKYELIGIISYFPEYQTYFCISKNISDNQWYLYQDNNNIASKNKISDPINLGIPYMILYQKINFMNDH